MRIPASILCLAFGLAVLISPVQAQTYQIKEMTPEVKAALEGRRGRYGRLDQFKQDGIVGENNRGYVEVLEQGLPEARAMVSEENEDRRTIYRTIAEQNNLSKDALEVIEEVFAEVQREKAAPGEMIQTKEGRWVKK